MCYNFIVSLSVGGGTQTQSIQRQNETDGSSSSVDSSIQKSPAFLTAAGSEPQTRTDSQSATCQPLKDGEEMRYHGYTNPHKQSRSFQMLEQGLRMAELGQGLFTKLYIHVLLHVTFISQKHA